MTKRTAPLLAAALALTTACGGEKAATGKAEPAAAPTTPAEPTTPTPTAPAEAPEAAGHALLDGYGATLRALAAAGAADALLPELDRQQAQADELRAKGAITDEVATRHRRLLDVTRRILAPAPDDAARAAVAKELEAFAQAVQPGAKVDPAGGLAAIAPLLIEELLSLHMLHAGVTDREAARATYLKDLPPGR